MLQYISKRIFLGFVTLISLLLIILGISVFSIAIINSDAKQLIAANSLKANLFQKEIQHLNWKDKLALFIHDSTVHKFDGQIDYKKCQFGQFLYGEGRINAEKMIPSLKPLFDKILVLHKKYHESAKEIQDYYRVTDGELVDLLLEKERDHYKASLNLATKLLHNKFPNKMKTDYKTCSLGNFLYGTRAKKLKETVPEYASYMNAIEEPHKKFHELVAQMKAHAASGEYESAKKILSGEFTDTLADVRKTLTAFKERVAEDIKSNKKAEEIYRTETLANLNELRSVLDKIQKTINKHSIKDEQLISDVNRSKWALLILGLIATSIGISVALYARKIVVGALINQEKDLENKRLALEDKISNVVTQLSENYHRLRSLVIDLNETSNKLKHTTERQASATEETVAAMEEITSMVQQTSEQSENATQVATESEDRVYEGQENIKSLAKSVHDVKESNHQLNVIVDLINEIAEKTKIINQIVVKTELLSFNASIEAARAAEYGKGFAVVADEVGNLARLSGKSAKEIEDILQQSILKVNEAVTVISERVATSEKRTNDSVSVYEKIKTLNDQLQENIKSINSATREQLKGIQQSTDAMNEISHANQENLKVTTDTSSMAAKVKTEIDGMNVSIRILEEILQDEKDKEVKTKEPEGD